MSNEPPAYVNLSRVQESLQYWGDVPDVCRGSGAFPLTLEHLSESDGELRERARLSAVDGAALTDHQGHGLTRHMETFELSDAASLRVSNRVWAAECPRFAVDLEGSLADGAHKDLNTGALTDDVVLRWRGIRSVSLPDNGSLEHGGSGARVRLWLDASKRYSGGLLVDLRCAMTGRNVHCKIFHQSTKLQLYGAGDCEQEVVWAIESLQGVLRALDPDHRFANFTSQNFGVSSHDLVLKCVSQNAEVDTRVQVKDWADLLDVLVVDVVEFRARLSQTFLGRIHEVKLGTNRIHLRCVFSQRVTATVTLFRSGKAKIACGSDTARILAFYGLMQLQTFYKPLFESRPVVTNLTGRTRTFDETLPESAAESAASVRHRTGRLSPLALPSPALPSSAFHSCRPSS